MDEKTVIKNMPLSQLLEESGLTVSDIPQPHSFSPSGKVSGQYGAICRYIGIAERVGVSPLGSADEAVVFTP